MGQLLGTLFVLYILRAILQGLTQGKPSASKHDERGSRWSDVLDMDELEKRLREVRSTLEGRPDSEHITPAEETAPLEQPAADVEPVSAEEMPASSAPIPPVVLFDHDQRVTSPISQRDVRPDDGLDDWLSDVDDDEWDELARHGWSAERESQQFEHTAENRLPTAIDAYMQRGKPWQAAFVVKELLGPPRALHPFGRRHRF